MFLLILFKLMGYNGDEHIWDLIWCQAVLCCFYLCKPFYVLLSDSCIKIMNFTPISQETDEMNFLCFPVIFFASPSPSSSRWSWRTSRRAGGWSWSHITATRSTRWKSWAKIATWWLTPPRRSCWETCRWTSWARSDQRTPPAHFQPWLVLIKPVQQCFSRGRKDYCWQMICSISIWGLDSASSLLGSVARIWGEWEVPLWERSSKSVCRDECYYHYYIIILYVFLRCSSSAGVYDFQRGRAESGGIQQQRDPGISQNRIHEPSPHQVDPV